MIPIVTKIPIDELNRDGLTLDSRRVRFLSLEDIATLLATDLEFVIADCGKPLDWISAGDTFRFWKSEVKIRLIDPADEKIILDNHPGQYCYLASQWSASEGATIILLEKYH